MKDELGDRMKKNYEDRTRICLPRRSHVIIRIDGKAFHTYTRGLNRPFDDGFMEDMDLTATYLCQHIQNAKFAYVQSDEISILLSDYDNITTDAWFDNNIQKMASVSASMATKAFNKARMERQYLSPAELGMKWGEFDSRVFQIPEWIEVENYFIWRQQDCVRNSISSVAQFFYSAKELHGKSTNDMQELLFQNKGINWDKYPPKYKRGRVIRKDHQLVNDVVRSKWIMIEPPIFTQDRQVICGYVEKAGLVY
jgi:tRNA(His) guanylyltransferase